MCSKQNADVTNGVTFDPPGRAARCSSDVSSGCPRAIPWLQTGRKQGSKVTPFPRCRFMRRPPPTPPCPPRPPPIPNGKDGVLLSPVFTGRRQTATEAERKKRTRRHTDPIIPLSHIQRGIVSGPPPGRLRRTAPQGVGPWLKGHAILRG